MLRLYVRLIGARIRAQMQYKVSFAFDVLAFLLLTALEFATIAILLLRFGSIGGWSFAEIALLYGLSSIAFSLAEMAMRGFDAPFEQMMQQGAFDTLLIRPLPSFFQVLASEFQLRRLGRTIQGAALLIYALLQLPIVWTAGRVVLLPLTIVSGAVIYGALMIIGATLCFWTIKTPEVINAFTFGGKELTSYPLNIYDGWLRNLFLFVIPVGFGSYPAALALLNRSDSAGVSQGLAWLAPIAALLFLGAALLFWRVGVSRYQSTGT